MDINLIIAGITGTIGGTLFGVIALPLYKYFRFSEKVAEGSIGVGEYFGKRAGERVSKIKDKATRDQIANDIKNAPNNFDLGFDRAFDKALNK